VKLTCSRCRCDSCGEHFNSVSVFDRHRVGDWQDRGAHRRCLSVPEMQARNWSQNATGFWTERAFGNARECLDRARRSGDRLQAVLVAPP
jgi:DMSO/TMAO reductase YedYZ molybdopterin-dependent catalytic subunit